MWMEPHNYTSGERAQIEEVCAASIKTRKISSTVSTDNPTLTSGAESRPHGSRPAHLAATARGESERLVST